MNMTTREPAAAVKEGSVSNAAGGIEFKAVSMAFADGTVALKDLTLKIAEGEFVVLVGPSGCGKSTALRILAGLERATSGEVRIAGRDVTDADPQERDIAMVFQNYALYPHKSVYENLAYPLRVRGKAKAEIEQRVSAAASLLGITSLLARKPGALSGGQRQRVAMGRALVREPVAFLMDEPLSNLDAALRVEMRGEIRRLHRRLGVTTVYVTHDQVEAMTMGDRVAVMRGGVLQQLDAPQILYERPTNVFVASFIGSPSINLAMGELDCGTGSLRVGDLTITLPERRRPPGQEQSVPVIVGVRPEAFSYRRDPEHDAVFDIIPDLVESLGSELLVNFPVAAPPAPLELTSEARSASIRVEDAMPDAGTTRFIAKIDARSAYRVGSPAKIWFSTDHILLFDALSGRTILSSAGLLNREPSPH
jgi:multiple sugar transport system ATP-binding protein